MKLFFYIFLIFAPLINSMERITISHAGEERSYLLFIPTVQKESYKLVIGLHGFSGSASGFEKETTGGFNLYAEEQGLIVVYPQGKYFYPSYQTTDPKGSPVTQTAYSSSWNHLGPLIANNKKVKMCADSSQSAPPFPSCKNQDSCYWTSCVDDSDFIKTIALKIQKEFLIGKSYVMGLSNGGMMAQLIGCQYPDIFDGVINVVGMQPHKLSCIPEKPISLIIYGGLLDKSVPPISINSSGGYFYEPIKNTVSEWSSKFNCKDTQNSKITTPFVSSETLFYNCDNDVTITAIINAKAGHAWPGITPNEGYCRSNIQSEIIYSECKEIKKISGSRYLLNRLFAN
jgi:poly(3-hydroxybutyrate) depolymerase